MLRFAGRALKSIPSWLFKTPSGERMGAAEMALRIVPDVGFGVLAGAQTPGDPIDKLIAGSTQTIGGMTGGLALGKLGGRNQAVAGLLDMAGSVGGDFAGMYAGNSALRAKDVIAGGAGMTPWERMSADEQKLFAQQLEQQILSQYGIIPGTREQYMQNSGLA